MGGRPWGVGGFLRGHDGAGGGYHLRTVGYVAQVVHLTHRPEPKVYGSMGLGISCNTGNLRGRCPKGEVRAVAPYPMSVVGVHSASKNLSCILSKFFQKHGSSERNTHCC